MLIEATDVDGVTLRWSSLRAHHIIRSQRRMRLKHTENSSRPRRKIGEPGYGGSGVKKVFQARDVVHWVKFFRTGQFGVSVVTHKTTITAVERVM